jgi:hypothetical protein
VVICPGSEKTMPGLKNDKNLNRPLKFPKKTDPCAVIVIGLAVAVHTLNRRQHTADAREKQL